MRKEEMKKEIMRVVVLFSGNASSLKYLLETSPNINQSYKIVGAFTDRKDAPGIKLVKGAGIKLKYLDYRDWCRNQKTKITNLRTRRKYFNDVSQLIKLFKADIIMLSGFMLIITNPLLEEYKYRILNVHPADLTILDSYGKRKYVGKNVVAKVIKDGVNKICSTIHIITRDVDGGPILFTSRSIPISAKDSPAEIQEKMKLECDGPAYDKSLHFLATSKIKFWNLLISKRVPQYWLKEHSNLQCGNLIKRILTSF